MKLITQSNAEFKNAWSCTYIHHCIFMAWCLIKQNVFMAWYLVKHRDNFTFNYSMN